MSVGRPAPDELALVQEFVNSHHVHLSAPGQPHSVDALSDPNTLATWLKERGLLDAKTKPTRRDHEESLAVREAIRSLLLANNGKEIDPAALETLNRASGAAHFALGFGGGTTVTIAPRATGVRGALGHLLSIAADAMADGSWEQFKACLNGDCEVAFYDYSRNHSRKWCEMAVCGNRMKARAYRARKR